MFEKMKKSLQRIISGVDADAIQQRFDTMNRERSENLDEIIRLRMKQEESVEKLQEAQKEIEEAQKEIDEAQKKIEETREKERLLEEKRNGVEPWVEIKSADYDEVHGFKIELDWNEAFIQHLKESGLKGRNEEEIVQRWLGFLYGDLIERLEKTVIDKADMKRTNDFI